MGALPRCESGALLRCESGAISEGRTPGAGKECGATNAGAGDGRGSPKAGRAPWRALLKLSLPERCESCPEAPLEELAEPRCESGEARCES